MYPIINPLPLAFTLATTFGVLVHDTKIDHATNVAIAMPSAMITYVAVDSLMKSSDSHIHVERVAGPKQLATLRATVPRVQPRDDDRRYVQTKKIFFGGSDATSLWPSI
jgi:hypothetical protein